MSFMVRARLLMTAVVVSFLAAASTAIVTSAPSQAAESPQLISSDAETVPGTHAGDTLDDPAVWVNPTDSSRSLVIGNDKLGALETYDLGGNLVQRLAFGSQFWGNVDVLQGAKVGSTTRDLVGVVQRGVRFYGVDPTTRMLSPVTEGSEPIGLNGEGFCMYRSPATHRVYGISITIQGLVQQFELLDADDDGLLESQTVRTFQVGSEAEGCVADNDTGALYISEENVALWRYDAEPTGGTTREAVDEVTDTGGHLVNDIEGVTLVDQADGGGYLIVSAQGEGAEPSYFGVYRRGAGNDFVKTVRIADGTTSDDCDHTDGVTASTARLGTAFPHGIFVCQDNNNDLPGDSGNQDLKLVRLENVVSLGGDEEPPPPDPSGIDFVGQTTSNANATSFAAQVPATVRTGDGLLLFASQNREGALTGPGAGWTQIGQTLDTGHATTVWSKVATGTDAGTSVTLGSGTTYTKVAMTLAAYRGTASSNPIASITGTPETATTASHTTPRVSSATTGGMRVSYWSDKNSATTKWTAPAGETTRASTFGTGGGRIDTLLTDLASPLTAGSPATTGGLTATADAASGVATAWTLILRPGGAAPPPTNQPPTARFASSCVGLVCSFDGSTSSDSEGAIAGYAWDLADGEATGATPTHTYPDTGSYDVALTVTDADGATGTVHDTVVVSRPATEIAFVGQATTNGNYTSFAVQVPSGVQAGDALLLFASQNSEAVLTGPGAGWTQVGRVVDPGHATMVWRRVATTTDAGSTVQVGTGTTYTKVGVTLAAYRGTDASSPVLSATGAPETVTTAGHVSPRVSNATTGAVRLSYWSDKNSATTKWSVPAGETLRASSFGTGGGRVDTLLTDPGTALTAGSPATTGGLIATADAPSGTATTWTILLRPSA
jgi:myo-inositol-hexaphosphate 3-phosphohydrolase/PKD repeat protein